MPKAAKSAAGAGAAGAVDAATGRAANGDAPFHAGNGGGAEREIQHAGAEFPPVSDEDASAIAPPFDEPVTERPIIDRPYNEPQDLSRRRPNRPRRRKPQRPHHPSPSRRAGARPSANRRRSPLAARRRRLRFRARRRRRRSSPPRRARRPANPSAAGGPSGCWATNKTGTSAENGNGFRQVHAQLKSALGRARRQQRSTATARPASTQIWRCGFIRRASSAAIPNWSCMAAATHR